MEFHFQKFQVYQDAKRLHSFTVNIVKNFPRAYWHLADQMRRAALSIVLNIAEGAGKSTDKDFNRYIANALGSLSELAAAYDVATSERLVSEAVSQETVKLLLDVRNQLGGFSKKLLALS